MKTTRIQLGFLLVGLGIVAAGAGAVAPPERASVYPLKRLNPSGFNVFQGVLDWVPVSEASAVAFARNKIISPRDFTLTSFTLSGTGVASASRVIASEKGCPSAAACVWLEDGASGFESGASFGYVFVLFELSVASPESETASVWMAKFDAEGGLSGDWTEVLKVATPAGRYINGEKLFAFRRQDAIAVVPSLSYSGRSGQRKSLVYFIDVDVRQGTVVGAPVLLPLPQEGDYIDAYGYAPGWNGQTWLVPVSATLSKSPGREEDIYAKKALVYTVSADAAHAAVLRTIAADPTPGWGPFGDMWLTPVPGSASDQLLFLKKQKLIPEAQRKLEMYKYSFSLNRLDGTGALVKKQTISVPALTHKLVYDPQAKVEYPDDYWAAPLAKDGRLYFSRVHSTLDWKKSGAGRNDGSVSRYEQQYGFYTVDVLTGAVALRAQTATLVNNALFMPPVLKAFPSGSLSVVNTIWFYAGLYPRWSYFSTFAYQPGLSRSSS